MRKYVFFLVTFFLSFPAAANRHYTQLSREDISIARGFVKKLPQFSPAQDNDSVLHDLVMNQELSLSFESDQTDENAEDYPEAQQRDYVLRRLEDLPFLKKLTLISFGLREIPASIFTMKGLKKLDLSSNEITVIPADIGKLSQLEELDFSDNYLHDLPDHLGALSKLKRVRLSQNALSELPQSFARLGQMRRLDLSDNSFRHMPLVLLHFKKMTRLDMHNNLISYVPTPFIGLDKLMKFNLKDNPLVGVGWTNKLGARGLRAYFQKRVWISEERYQGVAHFEPISRERAVNESVWHVEKLAEARLFETPEQDISEDDAVEEVIALFNILDFEDERKKTYLDYTLLYEPAELESFITVEYSEDDENVRIERFVPREMTNKDMMTLVVLPKIKGFTQQLFREDQGDQVQIIRNKGWQPKTKDIPAFRNGFVQALDLIESQQDISIKIQAFMMLMKGMLHCPTAQKSAFDTIIAQFSAGAEVEAQTVPVLVQKGVARLKENVFRHAMTQDNNAQNTHLLEYYKNKLGDILGLSSSTKGYTDELGRMGDDRFYGRAGNALACFFVSFEPGWVAQQLCHEDFNISPREMGAYLIEHKLVDYEGDEEWWQNLFSSDPTSSNEARVEPAALSLALRHLGYVKH